MSIRSTFLAVLSVLLASCGGGGGGSDGFLDVPFTIGLHEATTGSVTGGGSVFHDQLALIGDNSVRRSYRAFYGLQWPAPAPGFRVRSAIVHFEVVAITGSPFPDLGIDGVTALAVDLGPALDPTDYASPPFGPPGGLRVLSAVPSTVGATEMDVTEIVRAATEDGRTRIGLRLSFFFETDGDTQADLVGISAIDTPGPTLTIEYEPIP